jgi:phthalate 4,5-cis-dihydrodiol dehydrogenase
MNERQLRIGVIGLGRAFTVLLPTFLQDSRVKLVGATDPRVAARRQFEADFGAPTYPDIEALCAAPNIEAVYIATPHQLHADHVCLAAAYGKHVLVEKPMAISLDQCTRMIDATSAAGVHLIVGPSHSFDRPIQRARELIESGLYGKLTMITAQDFTDFLYRPRRPEELRTAEGGGVVHSQAAHQMDIVRLLGGGRVRSLYAHTGAWDPERPTEGAYAALLRFEDGAFCSATYSGYGYYDSSETLDGIGESGQRVDPLDYGAARRRLRELASVTDEAALKAARNYGGPLSGQVTSLPKAEAHPTFGHIVISCEKADLRPSATGVMVYSDERRSFDPLVLSRPPRAELIDELYAAVVCDTLPVHGGAWSRATTEVCLAILESARTRAESHLHYQVGLPPR